MKDMILKEFEAHAATIEKVRNEMQPVIAKACQMAVDTINAGGKILLCGNGGSAADSQHIAAELTGRYKKERNPLPGIALTTDTSAITAIANDYAYEDVFSRQVLALAQAGDLVIGISTTGNSMNVMKAFDAARMKGCKTLGLSGKSGGKFEGSCDLNVVIPSNDTARIQEMHIMVGHMICQAIDNLCSK
jgi:D-sedoheptulose 7-phosphate isomerase